MDNECCQIVNGLNFLKRIISGIVIMNYKWMGSMD